jgi:hypothetical protein
MKKWVRNFACAISITGCVLVFGCGDDSSSVAPSQGSAPTSSSAVEGFSAVVAPGSSDAISSVTLSSAVIESSSSVAAPAKFCHFAMTTHTGYYPMAVTTGVTSICLPLASCDTSLINLGFAQCYEDHATVEGCFSNVTVTEVEECEPKEKSCESSNGTIYISGRFSMNCSSIPR